MPYSYSRTTHRANVNVPFYPDVTNYPQRNAQRVAEENLVTSGNLTITNTVSTDGLSHTYVKSANTISDFNQVVNLMSIELINEFRQYCLDNYGASSPYISSNVAGQGLAGGDNVVSGFSVPFTVTHKYTFPSTIVSTTMVDILEKTSHLVNIAVTTNSITTINEYQDDADFNNNQGYIMSPRHYDFYEEAKINNVTASVVFALK